MKLIALPSCLTMSAALSGISVRERGSAIEVDAANSRLAVEESGERRPRSKSNTKRLIVSAGCWKSKAMGCQQLYRPPDVGTLSISDSPEGCSREILCRVWRDGISGEFRDVRLVRGGYIPRSAYSGYVRPVREANRGVTSQGAQTMREMGGARFSGKFGGRQLLYNCYRYTIAALWFRSCGIQ